MSSALTQSLQPPKYYKA